MKKKLTVALVKSHIRRSQERAESSRARMCQAAENGNDEAMASFRGDLRYWSAQVGALNSLLEACK